MDLDNSIGVMGARLGMQASVQIIRSNLNCGEAMTMATLSLSIPLSGARLPSIFRYRRQPFMVCLMLLPFICVLCASRCTALLPLLPEHQLASAGALGTLPRTSVRTGWRYRGSPTAVYSLAPPPPQGNGPSEPILRVAYQGEPGAYSEKSTRELLGENVVAIGRPSFEDCFHAVASMECDYACLPIENSLGGSIHDNYDLMLRYDLQIVAEHEFRVQHCLLTRPGVKREDIQFAISHPQALAQCDNYLRGLGITPIATYDTAGSAKMLANGEPLPDRCKPDNTAAIASELAGHTYGLQCLAQGVEDDDTNFTRFLLLSRKNVELYLNKNIPAKTSIVFTFPNSQGALFKSLASFALRDIDCSKIESRPTSASLLNYLKYQNERNGGRSNRRNNNNSELPRFRYCFYLDFLASSLDTDAQNALSHLREQADFVRILGSYPQKSRLVGPVKDAVDRIKHLPAAPTATSLTSLPSDLEESPPLKIGIIGLDPQHDLGLVLAKSLADKQQTVVCTDMKVDRSEMLQKLGLDYIPSFELQSFLSNSDVVILTVPLIDLESTVLSLPENLLRGKLIVEVGSLNAPPKSILLHAFGNSPDIDLLTCHLGPEQCVYDSIRIADPRRATQLFDTLVPRHHRRVEMPAAQHDALDPTFVTEVTAQLVHAVLPQHANGSSSKRNDATDLLELYRFNPSARQQLGLLKDELGELERELVAKDSYLSASIEMKKKDRQQLLAETKLLLREIAKEGLSDTPGLGNANDSSSERRTSPPRNSRKNQ